MELHQVRLARVCQKCCELFKTKMELPSKPEINVCYSFNHCIRIDPKQKAHFT